MKQNLLKRFSLRVFMLVALLASVAGSTWAAEVTFAPSDFTATTGADFSLTKNGITVAVSASTVTSSQIRVFKGQTLTISSTVGNITGITFTCNASGTTKYGPGCFTADKETYSYSDKVGTWTGSTESIVFTASSNQVRIDSEITVTYEANASTSASPIISGETSFLESTEVTISAAEGADIYYTLDGSEPTTGSTKYTGAFTLEETTTVKAIAVESGKEASDVAEKTFTKVNVMTVAEAIEKIDADGQTDNAYVKGIISQIDSYSSTYKSITYWISDDGTTTNQFEVYSGKGVNGADFSSVDDLEVGDKVTVKGTIKLYNSTYEFDKNSIIVSLEKAPVVQVDPTIVVADASVEYGKTYTVDTDEFLSGEVSLTSGNEAVATVSGLTITPVAVGSVVITVNAAESAKYYAGSETFTLTVTAPEGNTVAPSAAGGTIFEETFNNFAGTGGNDDKWNGSIASSQINNSKDPKNEPDHSEWAFEACNAANACLKLGSGKVGGSAVSPALGQAGNFTLTFRAGAWDKSGEGTTLNIAVSEGTVSPESVELTMGEWNDFTLQLTDVTAETTITFSTPAANNRAFLDEIKVSAPSSGAYTESVTLNSKGYASYASINPLDFSEAEDNGFSAWAVTKIAGTTINFDQITTAVKGGEGVLLKGEAGATVEIPAKDCEDAFTGNLLEGTLAPTYVEAGKYYGLSGDQFLKVKAGTVKAGKAILPVDGASSEVKAFTFVFNGTDGIQTVETVSAEEAQQIFDLSGRQLAKPTRGINIVNGKKVLVK